MLVCLSMIVSGPLLALLSAASFGISPALSKLVIGEMSPILLAGLLYLGSGIGLQLSLVAKRQNSIKELRNLSAAHRLKLLGAIVSGGILAPIFLVYGIKLASAFEVSLLLNFETVATTIIAWLVFHEHIGARVWFGKLLLLAGAVLISFVPDNGLVLSTPSLLVIAACVCWGIDNNLTRDVESLSPSVLASMKGLAAGTFNTILALVLGHGSVTFSQMLGSLGIGALSYGLSLVLFVKALRAIGASRTSTYFAIGPFFGMVFSVFLLGERPPGFQWLAALVMAAGTWILYRESHEHPHTHESLSHRHEHVHDDHHQHSHDGNEGPEPHDHLHTHERLAHSHVHWPDIHHRHSH